MHRFSSRAIFGYIIPYDGEHYARVRIIEQVDSTSYPGLQAVDFVAWAIQRKYEGDGVWAELIQDRVVAEELIRGKKTAALPGGR